MIVKDEEETLERILKAVKKFADEIIVVDTGSQDKSKEIAKRYTNKVYDRKWVDFADARNYSFSLSSCDYQMWLDADDVITEKAIEKLNALKGELKDEDIVMLPYETLFDENDNVVFRYYRERILRRNMNFVWLDPVHEAIVPRGKIVYRDIPIQHRKRKQNSPFRNLRIYQEYIKNGGKLSSRQRFYYANELYYNNLFTEALCQYEKLDSEEEVFLCNRIQSYINSADIYLINKEFDKAVEVLTKSFNYSLPNPAVLCGLGRVFFEKGEYNKAIYWYELATKTKETDTTAFLNTDLEGFLPYVQIGLCYYYLGDLEKAIEVNEKALKLKPYSKVALNNNAWYKNKKS